MKHFRINEFESPDEPGSGVMMSAMFLDMIDKAREIANIPFIITSGFRTESHNKKVKGVKGSAHLSGLAADISCTSSSSRLVMVDALIRVGFKRIGIAKTFIHCDIDSTKPNAIFLY